MDVTAIILAGGKHIRLGRPKAQEPVGGKRLIERVIERLRQITGQIMIVTSQEEFESLTGSEAEVVVDLYPDKGPLVGIYTGLLASQSLNNIVVACDMPFLNVELLRYLVGLSEGFDAVVPRVREEAVEPLHAIYSKNCLASIKTKVEREQLGVNSFFNTIRVRYVERAECQNLDPQLLSFFNINYQSDLERAEALAEENK